MLLGYCTRPTIIAIGSVVGLQPRLQRDAENILTEASAAMMGDARSEAVFALVALYWHHTQACHRLALHLSALTML